MELKDTIEMMTSSDYKERFKGEYWQLKIRAEKLKNFCNKLEASETLSRTNTYELGYVPLKLPAIEHNCPSSVLKRQLNMMYDLLHILELRAEMEKINLKGEEV